MNRDEITRIFRNPPYIETRRLVLRKMQKNDAAAMYEYARRRAGATSQDIFCGSHMRARATHTNTFLIFSRDTAPETFLTGR